MDATELKQHTDAVIAKVDKFKQDLVNVQEEANKKAEQLENSFETKNAEFYKRFDEIAKDLDTKVKAIQEEIKGSEKEVFVKFTEDIAKIQKTLKEQSEAIAKGAVKEQKADKKFHEYLREAIEEKSELLTENTINGKKVKGFSGVGSQHFSAGFEVRTGAKAAVDMVAANVLGGDSADFFTTYDPNLVELKLTNNVHIEQLFPAQVISDKYFTILVETGYTDGAETRLEGAAAAQSSFTLTTVTFNVFDISTDFKLSRETLEDMDLFVTEINRLAPDKIASKFDAKILNGSGDGTTDFKPLSAYATAINFATTQTDYAGTVTSANMIDVFAAVQSYLESVNETPNFAINHTTDLFKLGALKDADGNSIDDRRISWMNGMPQNVSGLRIVKNREVGANKMFIGDVREAVIAKRGALTIQVGYNTDDWAKRMVTVRCDMRAAFAVRRNTAFAYVTNISQAVVDLAPAVS